VTLMLNTPKVMTDIQAAIHSKPQGKRPQNTCYEGEVQEINRSPTQEICRPSPIRSKRNPERAIQTRLRSLQQLMRANQPVSQVREYF
jgi:hypothetical protein